MEQPKVIIQLSVPGSIEYIGVNNVWENETCFLIGCGKSIEPIFNQVGLDWLHGKHSIGMNHIIEDYNKFEWFCFLDQAFLEKTSYDIKKYKGKIFARNTTKLKHEGNINIFHTTSRKPTSRIEDGLYHPHLTGLIALSLAIISGANTIYLLGYGNGIDFSQENYHYKPNYTGEERSGSVFTKMTNAAALYYKSYESFKDRIIHVTDGTDIPVFNKIDTNTFMTMFCKGQSK